MNHVMSELSRLRSSGNYRLLCGKQHLVDFSSNDYLGLARSSRVRAHLLRELESGCPLGATGSRLLSGQSEYHERVEDFLVSVFGAPSALIFSSGFLANLGVVGAFGSSATQFFSDELNHASIIDGLRLSQSSRSVFRHNDLNHLEALLARSGAPTKVIVTESVFSMDGDLAPLDDLLSLAERFEAWLFVDEAHATGVFGANGLGVLEGAHGRYSRLISLHTGGKALGGQGAFVVSSRETRELLINRARSFTFTTALAPLNALQIEYALREVLAHPQRGRELLDRAASWSRRLPCSLYAGAGGSQIIPLWLRSNERAVSAMQALERHGYDVRAIRSPSVPAGTERLRITIKSFQSEEELTGLLAAIQEVAA